MNTKISPRYYHEAMYAVINFIKHGRFESRKKILIHARISNVSLWKIIARLKKYGVPIKECQIKGYRLLEEVDLVKLSDIQKSLGNLYNNTQITLLESVASTNDYIQTHNHKQKISICISETQTEGKCRNAGIIWQSVFGKSICLSIKHPVNLSKLNISKINTVISLCVCQAIDQIYGNQFYSKIKWPNDILVNQKKYAGILCDTKTIGSKVSSIITGIGINLSSESVNIKLRNHKWGFLSDVSTMQVKRTDIISALAISIHSGIEKYIINDSAINVKELINRDYLLGKEISAKINNINIKGVAAGINQVGEMNLEVNEEQITNLNMLSASKIKVVG